MGVRVPAMSFSLESLGCLAGIAFLAVGALRDAAARPFPQTRGIGSAMIASARSIGIAAIVALAAAMSACTATPALPSSTIATLTITGSPPAPGATAQYSATVVLANSADVENVTPLATWQTANTAIAAVSKTGLITGVAAGSTTLTASYNGTTVTQQLTIP